MWLLCLLQVLLVTTIVNTIYVTESVCSFETSGKTQLCGWTNTVNIDQGMAGVMNASNAKAAFPTTDTNPGNENGSYFYYQRPEGYSNEIRILNYPRQKYISSISFDYYITGVMMLELLQIDGKHFDIISNMTWSENDTAKWMHAHVLVEYTDMDTIYGFSIVSPLLEAELGEAVTETEFAISIDNLTIEFTLPCNFDGLSEIGMFQLLPPDEDNLIILPGDINTTVKFTASSSVCPDGSFIYTIEDNNKPALNNVFSINSSTGIITVNAIGENLITEGVNSGVLQISVYVNNSDYLETGDIVKKYSHLFYTQKPTITISSPTNKMVEALTNFTYEIEATSALGADLTYTNFQTDPPTLSEAIILTGTTVSGQITQSGLIDVIKMGHIPTFTVDVSDSYDGVIQLTVQLLLPETPPTFDKDLYKFDVAENVDFAIIGNITVGDINENHCNDINVTWSSTDFLQNSFNNYIHVTEISQTVYNIPSLCLYLVTTIAPFDYEEKTHYQLNVTATDTAGQTTVAIVIINVNSVNEFTPKFAGHKTTIYAEYMSEVDKLIYELQATDEDSGPAGQLHYSISSGNGANNFKLTQISNEVVEIQSNSAGLKPGTFVLNILVEDGQTGDVRDDTAVITVIVTEGFFNCSNTNFGPPVITQSSGILSVPINDDIILHCDHTSFPPAYPVNWVTTTLTDIINTSPITEEDQHYSFDGNNLIIHKASLADESSLYKCNVSNPCGHAVLSDFIVLDVVEKPETIKHLVIKDGPSLDSIILTWSEDSFVLSASDIDGYRVKVKELGVDDDYQEYEELPFFGNTDEASITDLKPGTNYSVVVMTYNIAGESESNVITFMTDVSAPQLSKFEPFTLTNHSIRIEWVLGFNGGSDNIQMSIELRSHEVRRKRRSADSVAMTFDVEVNQNSLITPALPFGQSYEIMAILENEYGTNVHTVTTFVGFQDVIKCSFTNTSSCGFVLSNVSSLQLGDSHEKLEPTTDATNSSMGAYVIGEPTHPFIVSNVLSYNSISYLCGYSFYYQIHDTVSLALVSESKTWNETSVYWTSTQEDTSTWVHEEVPAGEIPFSVTPHDLIFLMETFDDTSVVSFVAVDEVSLYVCLPCDLNILSNNSFVISTPKNATIFLRSYQKLKINTELNNCSNPILNYVLKDVIPNHFQSKLSIPNPREGTIVIDDVTPDMANIGQEGIIQITVEVANIDYKHDGLRLSKFVTIPFIVSEKFENCSDIKSCYFDNGLCDWTTNDQSEITTETDSTGNVFLQAKPLYQNSKPVSTIMEAVINDSYCGISFLYKTFNSDLQVSVEGLGLLWSTIISEELADGNSIAMNNSWQETSLYIDVTSVEIMTGRMIVMEMLGVQNIQGDVVAMLDNVTLHPCVDCQAKECSCISCIKQCTTDPCQSGYYLSLEINQCRPCPNGYYCSDWRSLPMPCPPGTFYNKTGAQTEKDCQACPQGTYSISTAANTCMQCPPGHFCIDGSSLPVECPIGTYYNGSGAQNIDMCQVCPDNFYSLRTGVGYCEECPSGYDCVEAGKLPVANTSAQNVLAAVIGAVAGSILLSLIATVLGVYCYCRHKNKKSVKRKREKKMYKDNFLYGLDDDSSYIAKGPRTGTVRTVSTILSLKNERLDDPTDGSIQNQGFYDSNDSSDDEPETKSRTLLPLGKYTNSGTVSSLKSLGAARNWTDTNPFSSNVESQSDDMSVLIELDDDKDHVWDGLKMKKNKPESQL